MSDPGHTPFAERSAWARSLSTPVRVFVHAQAGSAIFLLGGALAALVWANVSPSSYESFWTTHLDISLGDWTISEDLRHWVNDGLMALFFFVVGLEARRELDMGELRERKRISLPVLAGVGGMAVPVADLPGVQRGRATRRPAGASRCRPTPPSRSACWPWSAAAPPPGCASSC